MQKKSYSESIWVSLSFCFLVHPVSVHRSCPSVSDEPIGVLLVLVGACDWVHLWASGLRRLASGRSLCVAEQAGCGLALGGPHTGPLTAGSEDTALWSSLGGHDGERTHPSTEWWSSKTTEIYVLRLSREYSFKTKNPSQALVRLTWPPPRVTPPPEDRWEAPHWADTSHCLPDTQEEEGKVQSYNHN